MDRTLTWTRCRRFVLKNESGSKAAQPQFYTRFKISPHRGGDIIERVAAQWIEVQGLGKPNQMSITTRWYKASVAPYCTAQQPLFEPFSDDDSSGEQNY